MVSKFLFIHAMSPLHAGTGQGVGIIDMPIAREKATGLPYLPGSSLKGSLRDLWNNETEKQQQLAIFGPNPSENENASEYAGAAQFGDAKLLLLPTRSIKGTFAWVTSPYILGRFTRDAKQLAVNDLPNLPSIDNIQDCIVTENSPLADGQRVYFEDLDLNKHNGNCNDWANWLAPKIFAETYWQDTLKKKLCIVHDDVLSFLLNTATEVVARISIDDDSKTVRKGGLWYEENLPAETVLHSLMLAKKPFYKNPENPNSTLNAEDVAKTIEGKVSGKALQLGGNATVGKGLCQISIKE